MDLLASRGLADRANGPAASDPAVDLTLRGGPQGVSSPQSAAAFRLDQIEKTARRLRSTLLEYFVTPEATFVWTVTPAGDVRAGRIDVTASHLAELVRQARPEVSSVSRGEAPARAMGTRGGGSFVPTAARRSALRELDRLLIEAVKATAAGASGAVGSRSSRTDRCSCCLSPRCRMHTARTSSSDTRSTTLPPPRSCNSPNRSSAGSPIASHGTSSSPTPPIRRRPRTTNRCRHCQAPDGRSRRSRGASPPVASSCCAETAHESRPSAMA